MKLRNLDEYIMKVGSDITKFNGYMKIQIRSLHDRGQQTEDLLFHLFKGYFAVSDKVFVWYIESKKEKHKEGKNLEPDKLMQLADDQIHLLKKKDKWDALLQEEVKLLSLQAKIE